MPDKPDHSGMEPDVLRHHMPPRLKLYGILALCIAAAIVVVGLGLRFYSGMRTQAWTDAQAVVNVQTIALKTAVNGGDLNLPGDIEAFTNAPIYAQVSGTILKWNVDIGATVKTGDVLAQIDPRPYQAALDQAKGQMARDSATLANARIDLARYQTLAAQNAISNQQLSTQQATVAADAGVAEADRAAVQTASINLGYTRITAPFGGIVTSRSVDVGNLVMVGNASATPLFTVTDLTRLRIYVRVPQAYLGSINRGMTVSFSVPEYPGRSFSAKLAASSGAVASSSGTQLLEFQTENHDGTLKPGGYADMHFHFQAGNGLIRIPATALLFRDQGMVVATVNASDHVVLKPLTIQTDLGTAVDATGVSPGDRVIDNPPDSLSAGDPVHASPETTPGNNS